MKLSTNFSRAFTLMELTVASSIAAIILVSIVIGGVSLQRTFSGSDDTLKAIADQSRILDYVMQDLRQAAGTPVLSDGDAVNGYKQMEVFVPNYTVDPVTGAPPIPSLSLKSRYGVLLLKNAVNYGTTKITYRSPTATTFVRQEGAASMAIAQDCTSLQVRFFKNSDTSFRVQASFAPRFNFLDHSSATDAERSGTTLFATATLRQPQ